MATEKNNQGVLQATCSLAHKCHHPNWFASAAAAAAAAGDRVQSATVAVIIQTAHIYLLPDTVL
jgi:hypothetical protein